MQIKYDEIEWQWFSHAACYDQTASSQGMNHIWVLFQHSKTGLLEQGVRELAASITFIYLNLTVIHVCIWNRGIYLVLSCDVFRVFLPLT